MKKGLFLLCCLLLLSPLVVYAQDMEYYPPVTLPNTEVRNIYSEIVGQEYVISVALPSNYHRSDDAYPVLYLLNPDDAFGMVVNTVQGAKTLTGRDLPELIIIGIGHVAGADEDLRELATRDHLREPENFLQFFKEELFPYIDTNYRSDPSERAIAGFEGSGYFTLYSLFNSPETFNRYIVVAPTWDRPGSSVGVRAAADRQLHSVNDFEEAFAAENTALPVRLFLAASMVESAMGVKNFCERLEDRAYGGLVLTELPVDAPVSTLFSTAIASGLNAVYCNEAFGCFVAAPVLQAAPESIYAVGDAFTTPDAFLSMAPSPGSFDLGGTCPKQSEATVLQILADESGKVWFELECGRSSGWVKESDLLEE